MLLSRNIRLALNSQRSSRWRSALTMLGVIIGVASVVVTVSIGEGVKKQVSSQINQLGPELITIRPGSKTQHTGSVLNQNFATSTNVGSFSEDDWKTIRDTDSVKVAVPFSIVSGVARYQDKTMPDATVIGTTDELSSVLHQDMEYGAFFSNDDKNQNEVIIGKHVAENLFGELAPVGKSLQIRGKSFVVRGIFKRFPSSSLVANNTDYNAAIFIPYETSKNITKGQVQIYQVLAKAQNNGSVDMAAAGVQRRLQDKHGGEQDFVVLKHDENLAEVSSVLNLLTAFIAGVAAISLLVGGIGVMNIMLVLVSERTREIGVRKAVGATNHQIMTQFLVESTVITVTGGFFGIILSVIVNYLLRIFTDLQPVVTLPIMFISVGIALLVGIVFGTMPAVRAAKKDPIESLRYE